MKCERCNNLMSRTYKDGTGRSFCILAGVFYTNMKFCTHFEEKQDTKEKPKAEAKQTANKDKPQRRQPKKWENSEIGKIITNGLTKEKQPKKIEKAEEYYGMRYLRKKGLFDRKKLKRLYG